MSTRTSPQTGLLLAGVGAAGVLGSLWLPWYTVRVPEAFRDIFSKLGGGGTGATTGSASSPGDQIAAGFGAMMKGLVAAIPDEITGNGWQTMGGGDWVLAILSGLALLAVLAIGGGLSGVRADAGVAGRLVALLGAVCAGVAVYHVVRPAGTGGAAGGSLPGLDDAITVRYGIYVAAFGGLLMIAGGLLAGGSRTAAPAPAVADAPATPAYTPPEPYAPPVAPDPFATPAITASAPDPFAVPAAAPAPMPAADPFGSGAVAAPVASTPVAPPAPSAPREPGASIAPPGWSPPGA